MVEYTVTIKALTPIWTGDAERKNSRLRETGIIGSLRWWYEAVVRGLGGYACDPTDTKCEYNYKAYKKTGYINDGFVWKNKPEKNVCDACKLFGCTGWARKFRLDAETGKDKKITLRFIELKHIHETELSLLNQTMQIITNYGSLGAKMAEPNGLIEIIRNDFEKYTMDKQSLDKYFTKTGSNVESPNIKRFIFINRNVNYSIIKEMKNELIFLKGERNKGKKYFYKVYKKKPYRFFTYARDDSEYSQIVDFLNSKDAQFRKGEDVLQEMVK